MATPITCSCTNQCKCPATEFCTPPITAAQLQKGGLSLARVKTLGVEQCDFTQSISPCSPLPKDKAGSSWYKPKWIPFCFNCTHLTAGLFCHLSVWQQAVQMLHVHIDWIQTHQEPQLFFCPVLIVCILLACFHCIFKASGQPQNSAEDETFSSAA